ncbi:MAG: MFS transporter [Pseudomonadota bacterium]
MSQQRSFFLPITFMYTAIFAVVGPIIMFFPLFLEARNLSVVEIGYAISAMGVGKLLSVFIIAMYIDKSRAPHMYLVWAALIGGLVMASVHIFDLRGAELILVTFLFSCAWSMAVPLSEGFSMRACRLQKNLNYGHMRLFGSVSFLVMGTAVGFLIDKNGISAFLPMVLMFLGFAVASAMFLPNFYHHEKAANIIDDSEVKAQNLFKMVASNVPLMVLIIGVAIMHSSHAVVFQYGPIFWSKSAYDKTMISAFISMGVIAEVILFWFAARLNQLFSAKGLLLMAGVASAIRWFAMAFDPATEFIFFFQSLHAFTFGALHLGVIRYINDTLQGHYHSAAQLIYAGTMWGLVMIPVSAAAGYLYNDFGTDSYFIMSLIAVFGLAIAMIPFMSRRSVQAV